MFSSFANSTRYNPENGRVGLFTFIFYQCNPGYIPSGPTYYGCFPEGWEHPPVTCDGTGITHLDLVVFLVITSRLFVNFRAISLAK